MMEMLRHSKYVANERAGLLTVTVEVQLSNLLLGIPGNEAFGREAWMFRVVGTVRDGSGAPGVAAYQPLAKPIAQCA